MKLFVSYQPILKECMRAGGFTHYLIITIVRLYLHNIAGNHNYILQLHHSDCQSVTVISVTGKPHN